MWKFSKNHVSSARAIKSFMTSSPRTLEARCHFVTAKKLMHESGYRHVPILNNGKIIGILSDRDIRTVEYANRNRNLSEILLSDVCLFEPCTVDEETPLAIVLDTMIDDKIGSVVVERKGKVVGIFTTIDACIALRKLIKG